MRIFSIKVKFKRRYRVSLGKFCKRSVYSTWISIFSPWADKINWEKILYLFCIYNPSVWVYTHLVWVIPKQCTWFRSLLLEHNLNLNIVRFWVKNPYNVFLNLRLYKRQRCWKTQRKRLIHSKCMLSHLLAWIYSINHGYTNIVEDFDNSITFVSKEFFISDHMNLPKTTKRKRAEERERERERESKWCVDQTVTG